MIITKKEFKDAVKKVIIEAVKEIRDPNFTEEENKVADKNIATVLTDYYEKVISNIFCGDCWTYSKDELTTVSGSVLNDRFSNNPEPLVFMENVMCVVNTRLLINMLEEKNAGRRATGKGI